MSLDSYAADVLESARNKRNSGQRGISEISSRQLGFKVRLPKIKERVTDEFPKFAFYHD